MTRRTLSRLEQLRAEGLTVREIAQLTPLTPAIIRERVTAHDRDTTSLADSSRKSSRESDYDDRTSSAILPRDGLPARLRSADDTARRVRRAAEKRRSGSLARRRLADFATNPAIASALRQAPSCRRLTMTTGDVTYAKAVRRLSGRHEFLVVPLRPSPTALRAAAFLDIDECRLVFVLQEILNRTLEAYVPALRCARAEAVLTSTLGVTISECAPIEQRAIYNRDKSRLRESPTAGTKCFAMITSSSFTGFAVEKLCKEFLPASTFVTFPTWDELAKNHFTPEVVVVDVRHFAPADWDMLEQLASSQLVPVSILALDDGVSSYRLRQVLNRRLHGYITTLDDPYEIASAIRQAAAGEQAFTAAARSHLEWRDFSWYLRRESDTPGVHLLSPRETEVLIDVLQGLTSPESASKSGLAPSTVDNQRAKITKKLGTRRPDKLLAMAKEAGVWSDPHLPPVSYWSKAVSFAARS